MAISLAVILLLGLLANRLFEKLKMPGLLGMLILGVIISLFTTNLNWKERLFCVIAYVPKATVQAAMGAIPLSLGVESGDVILAIAVLSILITAPLGAIGIHYSSKKLLEQDEKETGLLT